MKRKPDVQRLFNEQLGKDSASIFNKVDSMLKRGVDRKAIEKAVADQLCTHFTEQMKIIAKNRVCVPCQ
jgi:hypothetical protein